MAAIVATFVAIGESRDSISRLKVVAVSRFCSSIWSILQWQ